MNNGLRPHILMTAAMPPVAAFDERFTVHRLWELPNLETFLAEFGEHVSGLAAGPRYMVEAKLLERLPKLKIIANYGAGYDKIDIDTAHRLGVTVTHTPDILTEECADTAIGLLISTVRRFRQAEDYLRAGHWVDNTSRMPPSTTSLRGRSIGIVGLGRIGKAIARRCTAMALDVSYWGRTKQANLPYTYHNSLVELATAVDTLIVALPGGSGTRAVVNKAVIAALGPTGVFVNVGRGTTVDEPALIDALRYRRLHAAGLDVFMNEPTPAAELAALDNVVLLPHIGSATEATWQGIAQSVFDNLQSWFDGNGPLTPIPRTAASTT
jgi:lactate dehydrogenase-like 2-hydroxyacid dehydrogenase